MNVLIACARAKLKMIPVTIETVYENENEGSHFHPFRDSFRIYKVILGSLIKFALFSVSAGIIEILVFTLMNETLSLPYWPCYLTALVCSVLWNFTFNRRFTFQSAGNVPKAMALVALFYCIFTPASTLLGNYLTNIGWNEYLVTAINMILNFVTEFLYDKHVVFRGTVDTNDLAKKNK